MKLKRAMAMEMEMERAREMAKGKRGKAMDVGFVVVATFVVVRRVAGQVVCSRVQIGLVFEMPLLSPFRDA